GRARRRRARRRRPSRARGRARLRRPDRLHPRYRRRDAAELEHRARALEPRGARARPCRAHRGGASRRQVRGSRRRETRRGVGRSASHRDDARCHPRRTLGTRGARAGARRGGRAARSEARVNLTPFGILALVAAALLGVVGTWIDALGAFPWWRLAVTCLVVGLAFEFVAVRGRRVSARWRSAARLFLGRAETLELELAGEPRRSLMLRTLPVLPDGIEPADPF